MNEILNNIWGVGVSLILLAFVMKIFFAKNGLGTSYYTETAESLNNAGQSDYAEKYKNISRAHTRREKLYFWPLLIIGLIMIFVSELSRI